MSCQSTLENGIRVVTKKMDGVRSVSVGFLFDASPGHERPEKGGAAHLTEHLMFKGTPNRDADAIAHMVDATGGSISAFTSRDYTCYAATVLDDYVTYVLDLFGDIFLNSEFSDASVRQEKESVKHELLASCDRPDIFVHEQLKGHIWKTHPLGRPIGGTVQSVAQLERHDILDYVNNNYRADRLIIGAAGNLDHHDFVAKVEDVVWAMESGSTTSSTPQKAAFSSGLVVSSKDIRHAYFAIGIKAAPFADSGRYGIHLLNAIVGEGISSRLFQRLRSSLGLVYEVQSEYQAYRDDGVIVIEGATSPESLDQVIEEIFTELQQIATGEAPITDEELWKAKMQLRGRHMIAGENSATIMSNLVTQTFYFDRYIDFNEIMRQIEEIETKDLNAIGSKVFKNGLAQAAVSIIGPENSERCRQSCLEQTLDKVQKQFQQSTGGTKWG